MLCLLRLCPACHTVLPTTSYSTAAGLVSSLQNDHSTTTSPIAGHAKKKHIPLPHTRQVFYYGRPTAQAQQSADNSEPVTRQGTLPLLLEFTYSTPSYSNPLHFPPCRNSHPSLTPCRVLLLNSLNSSTHPRTRTHARLRARRTQRTGNGILSSNLTCSSDPLVSIHLFITSEAPHIHFFFLSSRVPNRGTGQPPR